MKGTEKEITANLEPWAQRSISNLSQDRHRTILGFLQALEDDRVGLATMQGYVGAIKTLDGGKPYKRLTERDIRAWAREIDKRYKPSGAWLYKFDVRRFLKWVHTGHLDGDGYPPCVSWIKNKNGRKNYEGEILSLDEIKRLISVANSQRDRALLFTLYESGARASELVGLKIKDVEFDQYGAISRLGRGPNAKTGSRRVRLFEATPDLQIWLSMHPQRQKQEAPLWPSGKTGELAIQRRGLIALVLKYVKKAKLGKKISPHTFRHSRATHLATVLKEAQMREFFGWSRDSKMPSIYVHLSGRDVDQSLFEHYGIAEREEAQDSPLKKKVCDSCKAENSTSARFCWRCQMAFDTTKADKLTRDALEVLMGMVDLGQFREKLKEKGLDREITKLARCEK